jgi:hypothetical protein
MKFLTLSFLVLFSFISNAQDPLKFSDIITVENVSQKELFGRAKIWLAKYYKSSKDVIQTSDAETGQILGKALYDFKPKSFMGSEAVKGNIAYTISIYSKDGKYKYIVEDFQHEKFGLLTTAEEGEFSMFGSSKGFKKKTWEDMKKQSEEEAKALSESLKLAMGKKSEADF